MRRTDREIKDVREIESVIERSDVCRIALNDDIRPYIVSMNFGYKGGTEKILYFHCAGHGRKLDLIRKNNNVFFQIDTDHKLIQGEAACDFGMGYSSVAGWGRIFILTDEQERKAGLDSIMRHYSPCVDLNYKTEIFKRTTILKLEISEITCKKNEPPVRV